MFKKIIEYYENIIRYQGGTNTFWRVLLIILDGWSFLQFAWIIVLLFDEISFWMEAISILLCLLCTKIMIGLIGRYMSRRARNDFNTVTIMWIINLFVMMVGYVFAHLIFFTNHIKSYKHGTLFVNRDDLPSVFYDMFMYNVIISCILEGKLLYFIFTNKTVQRHYG